MRTSEFLFRAAILAFVALHARAYQEARGGPAELIVTGGRIVTLDEAKPEVEALAARDGRILAIGTRAEVEALAGPATERIELHGELVLPGFIEGHGHLLGIGNLKLELDLTHTQSWEEIVALVAEQVKRSKPGELVRGRGWHQEKWTHVPEGAVEGLPTHASLSAVSPENPVLLVHVSGHATFANAKAMELSRVDRSTVDPPGGQIVRDENGEPIGAFRETAAQLLERAALGTPEPELGRVVALAEGELLSKGITSFQDAGSSLATIRFLRGMAERGELDVRLWVMVRDSNERMKKELAAARAIGLGNGHLTVRAIKESFDGALGSHGAWLLEPYSDLPSSSGLNTLSLEHLGWSAELALANGFQLCVHAIGDRANREVLDLYEKCFEGRSGAALRWRIEHAQHLSPQDIPRFAALGVIASMQAVHCTSDGPWVPQRLGEERARTGAYVWRSLLATGAVVTNGTDAPVEDVDPIPCFYSAVTRKMADGRAFHPEQCMTRMEALRSYTLSPAYAAFEEDEKGSLATGKLADLVVLSKDILTVPEEEIRDAKVLLTIVGGVVKYRR
jgi:predicted amidohydrolase YtcJ